MLSNKKDLKTCPLIYSIQMISGKWKPFILWYLKQADPDSIRYGALRRMIPWDLSHKMFTQQLHELEDDHMIIREEYDEVPPHVEYRLTEKGLRYAEVLELLRDIGSIYGEDFDEQDLNRTVGIRKENTIIYPPTKVQNASSRLDLKLIL